MKTEWTMTDEEWEDSQARMAEEAEEQSQPERSVKHECDRIWDEIEEMYGY